MKVFLIILAVLALTFAIVLSLSAEFTVIYENGWHTKIRVLFFEKDIELSKLLSFVLFPEKAAQDKKAEKEESKEETAQETTAEESQESAEVKRVKKEKKNYIQKILD